jgi:hypothetical protein
MTATDKIESFLEQMKLKFRRVPSEDRFILPYLIKERTFYVVIDRSDRWVRFHTRIISQEQLGGVDLLALTKELLIANGNLAEVKFILTGNGDVGVVGHEGLEVLTFDGFKQEYNAIPFAIGYFIENIAPKLGLKVPGFEK